MPLPTLVHASVQLGEPYAFQHLPSVESCHIIHVDYKVETFNVTVGMASQLNPGSHEGHEVRVDPLGTREERESEIRRILYWDDDHVLPVANAPGCEIVVYCCGLYGDIDYDIRTLVGMLKQINFIVVVEAPDTIDRHEEYLSSLGFTRFNEVQGHPSGNVWLIDHGFLYDIDMITNENNEVKVTITDRDFNMKINTFFDMFFPNE